MHEAKDFEERKDISVIPAVRSANVVCCKNYYECGLELLRLGDLVAMIAVWFGCYRM